MVLADSQMSHTMERGLGGGGFRSIKLNLTKGLAAIEDRTGVGVLAGAVVLIAERTDEAIFGEAADRAGDAGLAIAQQCQRIAGTEPDRGVERVFAEVPARAGSGIAAGGFEIERRFDLAAGVVPDRQDGGLACVRRLGLRMRTRHRAEREQQGK